MFKFVDCIDAGTAYCPCELAVRGECIICSQLHGKEFCDCLNWKGTCMYQEFIWNGYRSREARQFETFNIVKKEYLRDDILKFDIKVSRRLARNLDNIGAFVFLKKPGDMEAYSTPISILKSDIVNNIITVVIKIAGIKTKVLCECEKEIMVKGPYWNGIQGQRYLKGLKNKSCLMLVRGIAAAPAVLAAKKLINNQNEVYVLLDRGRSRENFLKPYFTSLGCIVEDVSFFDKNCVIKDEYKNEIEQLLKKWNFKVVLSAGSDEFHYKMLNFINSIDKYVNFATVNNSIMCCGEGICGSCQIVGFNNERIKSCKQQYNPAEVFLRGMNV